MSALAQAERHLYHVQRVAVPITALASKPGPLLYDDITAFMPADHEARLMAVPRVDWLRIAVYAGSIVVSLAMGFGLAALVWRISR